MKTIVVDVDLTLVDTLTPWVEWWEFMTDSKFDWTKVGPDFSINDQLKTKMTRKEYMVWWNRADLYDELKPHEGSRQLLRWYSALGYEIFFVSKCEPGHFQSKVRFLSKYFPFHSGLINTAAKHSIEADIYFEDHVDYTQKILNKRPHAKVYQFVTRDNEYQLCKGAIPLKSWSDINELY